MSYEVGSAYVRLRPNTSGFKSETEAGVRSGLSGVAKILAGAFAAGAVIELGKHVAQAAEQEQVAVTKAKRAVQLANQEWFAHKKAIEGTITAQARQTGFMKTDLYDAFANMVRTTKSVSAALKLNQIATDVSRTKGMDLASAQSLLARAYNGSFIGLKRLGIAITPVTEAQDKLKKSAESHMAAELIVAKAHGIRGLALTVLKEKLKQQYDAELAAAKAADKRATGEKAIALVQSKFAGQAAAYAHTAAGAQDRLKEAMHELEVEAGSKLLPTIANVGSELADHLPGALKEVKADTAAVSGFFHEWGSTIEPIAGSILGLVVALKAYHVAQGITSAITKTVAAGQAALKGVFSSTAAAQEAVTATTHAETIANQELQISLGQVAQAQGEVAIARNALNTAQASGVATDAELAAANDAVTVSEANLGRATLTLTAAREGQVAATEAATAAQAELDVAMDANPIGLVIAAVGLLTGALVTLYQESGTVRGVLQGIASVFRDDSFSAGSAAHATENYRKALADLKHDQQGVTDAHDRLAEAKLAVKDADANLTRLQHQGKQGTLEYQHAQLQLKEAHHGVKAALLALSDSEKKRNLTLGEGNKQISKAWNEGIKLSKTAELVAKWTGSAAKGSQFFASQVDQMAKKAGGAKTPLGEALLTLERLSKATGKAPSAAEWDRVFGHLTTLPDKALTKAQKSAETRANAVGNTITKSIIAGMGDLATPLGNYIANQINAGIDNAGAQTHGSGPFQNTIHLIGKPMAAGVIEGWNKEIAGLPAAMSETLRSAVQQAQDTVVQAIGEAKSNLAGIGGSLASMVNDVLAAPAQRQSLKDALTSAKLNLANLDVSANASPQELAAARAAVKAAQGAIDQAALQRRFADLSDELGKGTITKATFNKDVDGMLAKLGLSYKKLKAEMGVAFADQFRAEVQGLREQANAIVAGPRRPDITGFEPQIIKPLDAVAQGTQQVKEAVKSAGAAGLAEAKKQTAHLTKIQQAAADLALARTIIGDRPSPHVSPNHAAGRAKR